MLIKLHGHFIRHTRRKCQNDWAPSGHIILIYIVRWITIAIACCLKFRRPTTFWTILWRW